MSKNQCISLVFISPKPDSNGLLGSTLRNMQDMSLNLEKLTKEIHIWLSLTVYLHHQFNWIRVTRHTSGYVCVSVRVFQRGLTEPQTSPCIKHSKCKHSLFTTHISVFSRAQDNHMFPLRNQTSSDLFHSHSHTLPSKFFLLWPRNIYCLSNSKKHSKYSRVNGNHVLQMNDLV